MSRKYSESRRDFLKKSAVGATGLVAASSGINKVFAQDKSKGAIINPNINNLRVVYIEDTAMLQDGASTAFGTFTAASAKVKADVVKTNMDKMACALANEADAAKAWGIIFQKPTSKAWADVLIAIKPNCAAGGTTGQNYPHASIPIINTVCNALIALGAKAANMTIYDTNGFSVNPSTLYPAASMVSGIKFQGPATREYPVPVMSSISPAAAAADIIIDIASCKGHAASIGSTTLTMKNHLGTVGGHATTAKQIVDIHNSTAVLGSPVSGSVPPKQQLAIVDCLWTAKSGPTSAPDKSPCMIVMGTLCPAVDCFTAIKVRGEKLNYHTAADRAVQITYLTLYGYNATTDVEPLLKTPTPPPDAQGRGWIDAKTWTPTGIQNNSSNGVKLTIVKFSLIGSAFKPITKSISLKQGENVNNVSIIDIKGREIQNLDFNERNKTSLSWDARNKQGRIVSAGTYVLKLSGTNTEKTVKLNLSM
jgi:hypothetical protein